MCFQGFDPWKSIPKRAHVELPSLISSTLSGESAAEWSKSTSMSSSRALFFPPSSQGNLVDRLRASLGRVSSRPRAREGVEGLANGLRHQRTAARHPDDLVELLDDVRKEPADVLDTQNLRTLGSAPAGSRRHLRRCRTCARDQVKDPKGARHSWRRAKISLALRFRARFLGTVGLCRLPGGDHS